MTKQEVSHISLSIWEHRLSQVTEEMGGTLRRSALSPNIKERRDYSCALCDPQGLLVAQAAHAPVSELARFVLRQVEQNDVAPVRDAHARTVADDLEATRLRAAQ